MLFFLFITALSALADSTSAYRLGPEDVINVSVLGHQEFSGDYYIPSDGFINLPVAGRTNAAGKTLDELSATIQKTLSERLNEPEVSVSLKSPRTRRVYILGAVKTPGFFDAKPGWRLTEAIATAGGVTFGVEPSHCKVIILRAANGEKQTVNLPQVIAGGSKNLPVENGDVVTVDDGDIPVYVTGAVSKPGVCRIEREHAGIMEAIAMASGVTPGSSLTHVTITHLSGTSEVVDLAPALLDGKEAPKVKLESGDMVIVPESNARIAAVGWVQKPGVYPYQEGKEVLLSDAIGLAGGLDNKRSGTEAIAVVRTENGKQQRSVYNYKKFLKDGDLSQNPRLKPGDVVYVPETRKPDWDFVARSLYSIAALMNPLVNLSR